MDPNAPVKKQRSPLFYIAIGCGGLLVLIFIGFIAIVGLGAHFVKGMAEDITDPSKKAANVTKMLGAAPRGYYPVATLSVPMILDMAMLGDRPQPEDGGVGEYDRSFTYFRVIANEQSNQSKDFFDGKSSDTTALQHSGVNVEAKDVLKRGTVKTAGGTVVKYVATRGTMEMQVRGQGKRDGKPGINTLMYFECPVDNAVRIGVWSMQDAAPSKAVDELELRDTVADETEIAKFVQPLTPCGK